MRWHTSGAVSKALEWKVQGAGGPGNVLLIACHSTGGTQTQPRKCPSVPQRRLRQTSQSSLLRAMCLLAFSFHFPVSLSLSLSSLFPLPPFLLLFFFPFPTLSLFPLSPFLHPFLPLFLPSFLSTRSHVVQAGLRN